MAGIGTFIGSCIAAYFQPEKKYERYFPDDLLSELFNKLPTSEQASNNLALVCWQFYYISKKAREDWNKSLIGKIDYISQSINDSYNTFIKQQTEDLPWWDSEAISYRISSISIERIFSLNFSHGKTAIAFGCTKTVPDLMLTSISFILAEKIKGSNGLSGVSVFRDKLTLLTLSPTVTQEEKWIAKKVIQKVNSRWF